MFVFALAFNGVRDSFWHARKPVRSFLSSLWVLTGFGGTKAPSRTVVARAHCTCSHTFLISRIYSNARATVMQSASRRRQRGEVYRSMPAGGENNRGLSFLRTTLRYNLPRLQRAKSLRVTFPSIQSVSLAASQITQGGDLTGYAATGPHQNDVSWETSLRKDVLVLRRGSYRRGTCFLNSSTPSTSSKPHQLINHKSPIRSHAPTNNQASPLPFVPSSATSQTNKPARLSYG